MKPKSTHALAGFKSKCERILKALSTMNAAKLLQEPVDLLSFSAYELCIPHPMSFSVVRSKLAENGSSTKYLNHNEFALDVRRICGNFIRYNCTREDAKLRGDVVRILVRFEEHWKKMQDEADSEKHSTGIYFSNPLPELKKYLQFIEECYRIEGVLNFIHPINFYFREVEDLRKYDSIVSHPMDLGTIISKIVECDYSSALQIKDDLELLVSNCEKYWSSFGGSGASDGAEYIKQSYVIRETFNKTIGTIIKNDSHTSAASEPEASSSKTYIKGSVRSAPKEEAKKQTEGGRPHQSRGAASSKPESMRLPVALKDDSSMLPSAPWLLERLAAAVKSIPSQGAVERKAQIFLKDALKKVVDEVKKHFIKSATTSIVVMTATPFLKSVDPVQYPDYHTIVTVPMDFAKIEKKIAGDRYGLSVLGAVADAALIRENAHTYNVGEAGIEVRIMADQVFNYFKYLLSTALSILKTSGHPSATSIFSLIISSSSESTANSGSIEELLNFQPPEDVKTFLFVMSEKIQAEARDVASTAATSSARREIVVGSAKNVSVAAIDNYIDQVTFVEKKTAKIKSVSKLSSPAPRVAMAPSVDSVISPQVPSMIREKSAWEIAADSVLRILTRHPYVDTSKATVVANFFCDTRMVTGSTSKSNMNLTLLQDQLRDGLYPSEEEFSKDLISVFQNVVDHFAPLENLSYSAMYVRKCKHLVQYATWLCLEQLPVMEDEQLLDVAAGASPTPRILSLRARHAAQKAREDFIAKAEFADYTLTSCRKLMKDLERCRNKQEQYDISYFVKPVDEKLLADYAMYVRRPIDLTTIKNKVEARSDAVSSSKVATYSVFGDFVSDLRRVFSNAIKYNGVHRVSDSTGLSQAIYDAATTLQQRLEGLLSSFTIDVADRMERSRIRNEEESAKRRTAEVTDEYVEKSLKEFEAEQLEKLKATDKAYALDLDFNAKSLQTRIQMASVLMKQRLEREQSDEVEGLDALGERESLPTSHDSLGADALGDDVEAQSSADLTGPVIWSGGRHVHRYFAHLVRAKRAVWVKALKHWMPTDNTSCVRDVTGDGEQHGGQGREDKSERGAERLAKRKRDEEEEEKTADQLPTEDSISGKKIAPFKLKPYSQHKLKRQRVVSWDILS